MTWRRALRLTRSTLAGIAIAVGGLLALYAVAMNVFLGTRLFRHLISYDPGSLLVDYDKAYSLWPGRIHVEGLVIRGRDHNVEWTLVLDRCDFGEHFADLLHRQFHAGPVTCDGLNLRLRRRKAAWTAAEIAATPPVPGFSDPALPEPGPVPPPLTDANYKLWSIRLDDVEARHVREIWVDTFRSAGDSEVLGRWLFRPQRWLEVGPAKVHVHPVEVGRGQVAALATDVRGTLEVTVHPVDLLAVRSADIFHDVSVGGSVAADAHLTNLAHALAPTLRVEASNAALTARLAIKRGVVNPGSEIHVAEFRSRANAGSLSAEGSFLVDALANAPGRIHADVAARELLAKVGSHSMRGNMNVAVEHRRDRGWTDFSGSGLSFTGAAQTNGKDDTPNDWWVRAELRRAIFESKQGPHLRADVQLQARDASPLTAAVSRDTPLPSWLVNAVSTANFDTRGEILVSPSAIEARAVDARAKGVDASFAFLTRAPETDWALFVDLGLLKAGVGSHDGKGAVVLLGARSWFDERAATIRAAGVHD